MNNNILSKTCWKKKRECNNMPLIRHWQSFLPSIPCLSTSLWSSLLTQSKTNNYSELPVGPCWRDISWYSSEVVSKFSSVTPFFTKIQCPAGVNNKHTPLFTCVHPYNHLRSLARLLLHPNISEGNYYLTLDFDLFSNICTHFIIILELCS